MPAAPPQPRLLAATTASAAVRSATYRGREHLVVPVVALVEGLIQAENAAAPELVRAEELAIAPSAWNGRPVVLGHPHDQTGPISIGTPAGLEQLAFGTVFNARVAGGKLLMEAWLDVEQAAAVGIEAEDAIARLTAGELVDVSVGVFVVPERTADGTVAWTRITPDHLALLPRGTPGACSIEMGCGAPRAAQKELAMTALEKAAVANGWSLESYRWACQHPTAALTGRAPAAAPTAAAAFVPPAPDLHARVRAAAHRRTPSYSAPRTTATAPASADLGDAELRDTLSNALRADVPAFLGIEMVYPDTSEVIYAAAPQDAVTLYRRGYALADGAASFTSEPIVVQPVTSYERVAARAAAAAVTVPVMPDLHARVRAARGVGVLPRPVLARRVASAADESIPPAPSLAARVRAAAGAGR